MVRVSCLIIDRGECRDRGSLAMLVNPGESEREIHHRMPGVFMRIPEVSAWKMKYSRCQFRVSSPAKLRVTYLVCSP